MKTALIKVRLKYEFPDDMSITEIIDEVVNVVELPKEYDEDSFEWFGIRVDEDTLIPYHKFPITNYK